MRHEQRRRVSAQGQRHGCKATQRSRLCLRWWHLGVGGCHDGFKHRFCERIGRPQKWGVGGGIATPGSLRRRCTVRSAATRRTTARRAAESVEAYTRKVGRVVIASTIDGNTASYGGALPTDGVWHHQERDDLGQHIQQLLRGRCVRRRFAHDREQYDRIQRIRRRFRLSAPCTSAVLPPTARSSLQSSIIAKNTAGASNVEEDLYLARGHGVLSGADNLVMSTNIPIPPPGVITVTSDPKLGPLQFNGGATRTRALLPGSPALGEGQRQHDADARIRPARPRLPDERQAPAPTSRPTSARSSSIRSSSTVSSDVTGFVRSSRRAITRSDLTPGLERGTALLPFRARWSAAPWHEVVEIPLEFRPERFCPRRSGAQGGDARLDLIGPPSVPIDDVPAAAPVSRIRAQADVRNVRFPVRSRNSIPAAGRPITDRRPLSSATNC